MYGVGAIIALLKKQKGEKEYPLPLWFKVIILIFLGFLVYLGLFF